MTYDHSVAGRARWRDPEYREKVLKIMRSPEHREKQSKNQKKLHADPDSSYNSHEYREKISKTQKERWEDPTLRENYSKMMRERWTIPEHREKISRSISGEKHPNWRGGISREPYPFEFNDELRRMIRDRDGDRCTSCGSTGRLAVHHINRVKEDLNPENLITLCFSCHGKAHQA